MTIISVSLEEKALDARTCNTYERINTIAFHPVPSLLSKNKSLRKIKGVPDGYIVVVVVVIVIVVSSSCGRRRWSSWKLHFVGANCFWLVATRNLSKIFLILNKPVSQANSPFEQLHPTSYGWSYDRTIA